eukprot:CAMPEP_0194281088 /NCGR_PEP_ID=MMETSP0169-20130528/19800_1 /TAXON_ID=218684 /ORGANISM="Corethron pennatum, Strain L29A3" /LENGTH=813 /DNA_ID=CAMNT_0039026043 /DNA_START=114 /DNA_END=2555 /DNA_ORIENTATION=+
MRRNHPLTQPKKTAPATGRSLPLAASLLVVAFSLPFSAALDITLDQPFQQSLNTLPHAACTTLFHRNGRVGCGTPSSDSVQGTLLSWDEMGTGVPPYSEKGSGEHWNFIAVFPDGVADIEKIASLEASYGDEDGDGWCRMVGVLVVNATTDGMEDSYYSSPMASSPQGQSTPSADLAGDDYDWNVKGDGLFYKDRGSIPTAIVTDRDISTYLLKTSRQQASDLKASAETTELPLVSADMNFYMGGADIDSKTCLTWTDDGELRPKCLPLGGNSLWATAGSRADPDAEDPRDVVMLAVNIDGPSQYQDLTPAANSAAGNILAGLMAARAIGELSDNELDGLPRQVAFGFFQGEKYGYIGSRAFFADTVYPGFECREGSEFVQDDAKAVERGFSTCLYPMRPSTGFQALGQIHSVISVDQVAFPEGEGVLYAHKDGLTEVGEIAADILVALTNATEVIDAEVGYAPPSPVSSLARISANGGGEAGGAVLSGYSTAFSDGYYGSHLDSALHRKVDMESIAAAATVAARAAIALAYYDGDSDDAADDAAEYAAEYATKLLPDISADDEMLLTLSQCLFYDGNCDYLKGHVATEDSNENNRIEDNMFLSMEHYLDKPPNFNVGVYTNWLGQPFIRHASGKSKSYYGSYKGDDVEDADDLDVIIRLSFLETSLLGILNDFLGRGSDGMDTPVKCKSTSDCSDVSYCASSGDYAVCAGSNTKQCVCSRARWHTALDPDLEPLQTAGTFQLRAMDEGDGGGDGLGPIYTEPYWGTDLGVSVFRASSSYMGKYVLVAGALFLVLNIVVALKLKARLTKEVLF